MRNTLIVVLLILASASVGFFLIKDKVPVNIPQSAPPPYASTTTPPMGLTEFSPPEGFSMHVFAADVPGARVMAFDPVGALLVSQTSRGEVVALTDEDGDGVAEAREKVLSGLKGPHGLEFDCSKGSCTLYVAEEDAVRSYTYDAVAKKASDPRKVADLPRGGIHYTRSLLFLGSPNENTLLISIGSSCNVCDEADDRRAKILAYDTVSGEVTEYARGLRNAVFMTLHPVSGAPWATEMGRDLLGDDTPPDEINVLEKDKNYGWPICYGQNIHDTDFDTKTYIRNPCMAPLEVPAKVDLQAHSAPLGIAFIPEEGWPEAWWYDAVVAYHGSWNRSVPTGYKLVRIPLDAKGNSEGPVQDFITGFMREDGKIIGRPAGVLVLSGGTMYISDDQAGIVYRVSRK